MLCGRWRVTYLHLSALAVARGGDVARGTRLGRSGGPPGEPPHLHLGVRRVDARFGYVDPLPFLTDGPRSLPVPAGHVRRPRGARRVPSPARPGVGPDPRPTPRPAPATSPLSAAEPSALPIAPWPAWVAAALVLAGAWPASRRRARERRAPAPSVPREVATRARG